MNEKQPRKVSAGGKIFIVLFLILTAAAVYYLFFDAGFGVRRVMRMTDTQKGVSYDFNAGALFYSHETRFFYFCTKDGIQYVSSNGETKWREIFNLAKPVMMERGEMVAVGEESKGRRVYVFDPAGLVYSVVSDHPILNFSLNETGYLSVILQLEKGYAIHIYKKGRGDPIYTREIYAPLFHPVAADVSEDGRYIVIALLDLTVRLCSRVEFCYVNERDAYGASQGLFSYQDFPGQLVCHLRFMADNQVLVVTDEQISCFQPGLYNTREDKWTLPLHNKIDKLAFYGGSRFAVAAGDRFLNDSESLPPGELSIYNMNGECTGSFRLGRKATYLSMGHDSVIAGADRIFYALNYRGVNLWEYTALQDTLGLIFLENTDTVLMAGNARASILKRVKQKEKNEILETDTFDTEAD